MLLDPGLTPVSVLGSESEFVIVTELDRGQHRKRTIYSPVQSIRVDVEFRLLISAGG